MLSKKILPYLPAVIFILVYAWSLNYGYLWDDFTELQADLDYTLDRLKLHFRPIYYFSHLLLIELFDEAYQHRLVNILLLAGACVFAVRTAALFQISSGPFVVTAIFLHPTYVYPATWISQRNDGLLLLFLFMALANVNRVRGFAYLLLSDISKTPWVLQNLWYAWRKWREGGNRWLIAGALLAIPIIIGQGLLFWADVKAESTSPMTQFTGEGAAAFLFILSVWAAKVVEAIILIHIPIAAFYGVVPVFVLAAIGFTYAAAWAALAVHSFRADWKASMAWHLLFLAILMSVPFAANNDPRVFGPAIPFFYLFWAKFAGAGNLGRVGFSVLIVLNLSATVLSYRISDTGAYDPAKAPDYTLCGEHEMQFPMERWRCDRSQLTHELVRQINKIM